MIEVRYHDRVNVLQDLFGHGSVESTPFDRPQWFTLLAQTGLTPLIAIASGPKAHAAVTLTETGGRMVSMRNWYSFIWRFFSSGDVNDARLLIAVADALKTRGHRVTFEQVPEEDGSATRLASAFTQAGWRVEVEKCDTNHVLYLEGQTFEQYWADRPGPLRTTLKRKAKKVDAQVLCHFDERLWDEYERIYVESWKPEEDHPAMLRQFAREEAAGGRLRFGIAWHDNQAVAAQCWTVENGTAFIHKLAYLKSARHLSAGTTLSAALFRHVIDTDHVGVVDFGTGDQSYKADWMNATRPRYRIDCINLRKVRGWTDLATQTARRLREPDVLELASLPPSR